MSTTPADATGALPARPATTAVPIHPLLSGRWSTRRFDPDARLDDATIDGLLEAARWAPSAFNGQPWRWLVFTHDDANRAVVESALYAGNDWAKNAAALFVAVMRVDGANGKPNPTRQHDTGLSAMSLVVEAGAMSARRGWHPRLEEDA